MNESNEALSISIKSTEITAQLVINAMQAFINWQHKATILNDQATKSLLEKGIPLRSVDIVDADLKNLRRELNSYSVQFEIIQGKEDGTFELFFAATDHEQVKRAFEKVLDNKMSNLGIDHAPEKAFVSKTIPTKGAR